MESFRKTEKQREISKKTIVAQNESKKCFKVLGIINPACKGFVGFYVGATYPQWYQIYVLNKTLINQHEISVTSANSGKGKNCTSELTIFLLKIYVRNQNKLRTGQSRKSSSVRRQSFGKPQESITRKFRKLFNPRYHSTNKLVRWPFVFLEVSGVSESFWCCPFVECETFG